MIIQKAFQYRLYPDQEQVATLAIQFGHARFVYNRFLATRKTTFFETGEGVSLYDFTKQVTRLKQEPAFVWLKQAHSQVLQQSLADADRAYQNFFRMCREGTLPPPGDKPRRDGMPKGYPRFWPKHDEQSIRFPQGFQLQGRKVYLPKVGWVQYVRHRKLEGKAKNCTVSKTKTGHYYISILCEIEVDVPSTPNTQAVGIDLGLKDFAILATETSTLKIEAPKHLRKRERLVSIRQRRVSRRVKGSNSRKKAVHALSATHEKITNRRKDFHHQRLD